MRATNAGNRRSVKNRMNSQPPPPRENSSRKVSEYENNSAFPDRHVAIFPNKPFAEGILCPTVKTAEAEGYRIETEIPKDIMIPEGHQLMSIDCDTFGEWQDDVIAETEDRQNSDDAPQNEKEMQDRIKAAMGGGSSGTIETRRTAEKISIREMEGAFREVVASQETMALEEVPTE